MTPRKFWKKKYKPQNLLNNAIKYTPVSRSPKILIKSFEEDGSVVIRIWNNGIGLAKTDQESIFKKFDRVSLSVEGSGVGLYLVNTIVIGAGGRITVEWFKYNCCLEHQLCQFIL